MEDNCLVFEWTSYNLLKYLQYYFTPPQPSPLPPPSRHHHSTLPTPSHPTSSLHSLTTTSTRPATPATPKHLPSTLSFTTTNTTNTTTTTTGMTEEMSVSTTTTAFSGISGRTSSTPNINGALMEIYNGFARDICKGMAFLHVLFFIIFNNSFFREKVLFIVNYVQKILWFIL